MRVRRLTSLTILSKSSGIVKCQWNNLSVEQFLRFTNSSYAESLIGKDSEGLRSARFRRKRAVGWRPGGVLSLEFLDLNQEISIQPLAEKAYVVPKSAKHFALTRNQIYLSFLNNGVRHKSPPQQESPVLHRTIRTICRDLPKL